MKISVIVPSYNSMPYVEEAIRSALHQLSAQDEIVIQDGASTDGTLECALALAAEDPRISVVSERDGGQSEALQKALERATGDFILWLNADDIVVDGAIEAIRAAIMSQPSRPAILVGGHQTLDHTGSEIARYVGKPLLHANLMTRGCYVFSGSMLVNRDALIQAGGFSNRFHYSMDLDLMFRLVPAASGQVVIEQPIGALRWHDASKSGSVGHRFALESWKVRQAHIVRPLDQVRGAYAFSRQLASLSTIKFRHSRFYRSIRGGVR
jgi:glycosyltransferase involved in cell wall biosynthesis